MASSKPNRRKQNETGKARQAAVDGAEASEEVLRVSGETGGEREKAGVEREKAGVEREKAGVAREKVGAEREVVGVEREKVGVAREEAGVAREKVGAEREVVGVEREKVGVEREKVGATREEVGVEREKAGVAREQVGAERERVGAAREEAGVARERAGAVREKAEKEETARAWSFIEILKKVGLVANTATSMGEAMDVTLDEVMKHFGYEVGHIYCRYGPEKKHFWQTKIELSQEFRDLSEKVFNDRSNKIEQVGIVGRALATQRPAWTTDAAGSGMPVRSALMQEAGLHSGIACPILSRDEVVGVMEFESTKKGEPPAGVSDLLLDIGVQMGRAIERVMAQEKLRAQVEAMERLQVEMGLINETGNLLDGCRSKEELGGVLSEYGGRLFPDCAGDLSLSEKEGSGMRRVASWGGSKSQEKFDTLACWALRRGRMHETSTGSSLRCAHVSESASWDLCIPLQVHQGTLGVLHLQGLNDETEVSAVRKSLANNLAEHVSLALMNFELRERLRYQAFHDLLTGLYNLRYFEETLSKALAGLDSDGSLALIKIDIDYFKTFNDDYGHDFGDEALRVLARFLEHKVRDQDTLCRVGGEEFMILMPGTNMRSVMVRAEAICRGVSGMVARREEDTRKITVSIGVATYPEHGRDYGSLMRSADQALYISKQNGRDQVTAAIAV